MHRFWNPQVTEVLTQFILYSINSLLDQHLVEFLLDSFPLITFIWLSNKYLKFSKTFFLLRVFFWLTFWPRYRSPDHYHYQMRHSLTNRVYLHYLSTASNCTASNCVRSCTDALYVTCWVSTLLLVSFRAFHLILFINCNVSCRSCSER